VYGVSVLAFSPHLTVAYRTASVVRGEEPPHRCGVWQGRDVSTEC
jgi:hypothetical protein